LAIFSNILINPKGGIEREMKTLRKIRKNSKALSPVVASIILIAVTVAVSIAVAAWMGALTVGFMDTEQVAYASVTFNTTTEHIGFTLKNTGTSPLVISYVYVNGAAATMVTPAPGDMPYTLQPNAVATTFDVTISDVIAGGNYEIKVVTSKNNPFMYTAIAPS
jgi:flagellin-like protein